MQWDPYCMAIVSSGYQLISEVFLIRLRNLLRNYTKIYDKFMRSNNTGPIA